MKYNNFLVMLALCVGFSSLQIQAAQQPASEPKEGLGGYLYRQLKSAMGYATTTATSVAQSAHKTVQDIGYQKVATTIMTLMFVAGQFGITPIAVLTMVRDFVMSPDLMKRVGAAAVTVASTTASVATSTPAQLVYKGVGLKYLGSIDTQNKYNKLAKEAVDGVFTKYSPEIKQSIADELSALLLSGTVKAMEETKEGFKAVLLTPGICFTIICNCYEKNSNNPALQSKLIPLLKWVVQQAPDLKKDDRYTKIMFEPQPIMLNPQQTNTSVLQPVQQQPLQPMQNPPLFQPNIYSQASPSQPQQYNPTTTYQQPLGFVYPSQQQYPTVTPPMQPQYQQYQGYPSLQQYQPSQQYQQSPQQNPIPTRWPYFQGQ